MINIVPQSKKAVVPPLFLIAGGFLVLIVIYLILLIPIPAFTSIRTQVNYWLILAFWIMLQVGLILGYFKVGTFALKGINMIRFKVVNWSLDIRNYIIKHT
jgi:hypothetical protein